jgi:PAS domain S-box-containing protein
MDSKIKKTATPWPLIVLFLIISASAGITGYIYYKSLEKHLQTDTIAQLSAIADLKVRQIVQWRQERLSDGIYLSGNTPYIRQFSRFLNERKNKNLKADLIRSLKSYVDNYDYRTAILMDRNLKVSLYYPDRDTITGDYLKTLLPEVKEKGEVMLTDMHQTGEVSFTHLDLIVPLKLPERNDSSIFGIIVLRIDPEKILFPILSSWPVNSKTAEAVLIHTEGNKVVFLNRLRHSEDAEMALSKPMTVEKLPAVMAVHGFNETSEGIDYRGIPVMAAMKKIPGSPWYLIAKIDREEVYASLDDQAGQIIIIILLFILMSGFLLGLLWWNQQGKFYREKYETELERMALVKHFDYILKYANDIILLVNRDFIIVEANDKACETYQYERKELIGKNVNNLRSPHSPGSSGYDYKIIRDTGHLTYETVHRKKDGTDFPVEISARKVDIEGITYYQSIGRDITERKRAEEILRESEDRFRKIFEESPFSMMMAGKDMGIIKVNSAFCKMLGYSEEELIGMTFRNFTHPDHISNDDVSLLRLVANDIPVYHTEKRYVRKDGSIIWGATTVSLIRNKNEEFQFSLAVVEDTTARKTAMAELDKSFSILKATLESTADGILVVDTEGKIVQYNRKFAEMWRIPPEVLNLNDDEAALNFVLNQLKDPEGFIQKVKLLYFEREAVSHDLVEFTDGRVFDRYSQPQKIAGKAVGRVWSFRDITELKKTEAELIASKEKAEESDRLKTAFLHNVSHEIRTPMNAILGFSSLLNDSGITEDERTQFINVIFQSSNQLLSIINDIVDLASIESGQVKLNLGEINLNHELRKLSEQYGYRQKILDITLSLKTPMPDREVNIITDGTKLIQILSNLINNAFKFTKKGKISFGYNIKDDSLEFFVKDTGVGILPDHQAKVFDRFFQVDSAVSRQYSGTGLGLSICKAYVVLMGGKIWLKSTPGEGSIFSFKIPYVKKEG